MLLILARGLDSILHVFANKENLAVWIVEVLWLNLTPGQVAKLFNDPTKYQL